MDCGRGKGDPSSHGISSGGFYLQIMAFGEPRNQKRKLKREDTSRCVEKELLPKALLLCEISSTCLGCPS